MNQYIGYIEEILHVTTNASIYTKTDVLPLYLSGGYELYLLVVQNVECLLARPKEQINLTTMRKQCKQLKKYTDIECVLCLDEVRIYTKEKMISEGIPFIIPGKQLYMPFLGIALNKNGDRDIPKVDQLSFSTQKLLLTALYENWQQLSLTKISVILGMSKMTITRCFDELQSLGLPMIKSEGKMRRFIWTDGRRALWEEIYSVLRNPVSMQYGLTKKIKLDGVKLGGISAICHYSMLGDNLYTTYAVSNETAKEMEISKQPIVPADENPEAVVQIIRYEVNYKDNVAVDPLTAILSLPEEEKADPRVSLAIDELLEECLND